MAGNPVIFTVFLAILFCGLVRCELFSAQIELENAGNIQNDVIKAIHLYVLQEEARLTEIQRRLVPILERSQKPVHEVVANPLSAFLLVKGLTVDLDDILRLAENSDNAAALRTSLDALKQNTKFPDQEDLRGAATAIARLQDTYLLDTSSLAKGQLNQHCCSFSLTADDCFELGRQRYISGDYTKTMQWMTEALVKETHEQQNSTGRYSNGVGQSDILEYLAFSAYQKGEVKKALEVTQQLLQVEPEHPRAKGNVAHYQKILDQKKGEDGGVTDQTLTVREKRAVEVGWEKVKYEALCRGEGVLASRPGTCRYVHNNNKFLMLGPVKQEIVHYNPNIYIYHDVITDDEISVVKQLAVPRFRRATVHNHVTGELETAQYRISKSAWLQGEDHPVVERLNARISDITGLDLETAEELQVANYGLAGHYEPHFDFAREREEKDAFKSLGTGNRIATFLFYMSDVQGGGATVFPSLGVTLWPIKGAAAFWYNLLEDGKGDLSTRHAACPVLLGSKWVSNKWIHERGQEFRRPCKLYPSKPSPYVDE